MLSDTGSHSQSYSGTNSPATLTIDTWSLLNGNACRWPGMESPTITRDIPAIMIQYIVFTPIYVSEFICKCGSLSATICLVDITFTESSGNKYFADDILFEQRDIAVFTRAPGDNCYLHFLIVLEFWL